MFIGALTLYHILEERKSLEVGTIVWTHSHNLTRAILIVDVNPHYV